MKTGTSGVTVLYVTSTLIDELVCKVKYVYEALLDGPYATVTVGGVLHPNPECPATWPSDDMIPQRGEMVGVSLSVLVAPTTCSYCAHFYHDNGAGARWMHQQLAPALATYDILKGVGEVGHNLSRIVETRLLRSGVIRDLLSMVAPFRNLSLSGSVWLVRRSEASSAARHRVLEGSLSHYVNGTSVVVTKEDCAQWGLLLAQDFCESDALVVVVYEVLREQLSNDFTNDLVWASAKSLCV